MSKQLGMGGSIWAVVASSETPPSSLTSPTIYCVEQWTLTASNDVQEVTDTCSGGSVARMPGTNSWQLQANAFFNNSDPQWVDLASGSIIDVQLNVGAANPSALTPIVARKITGRFIVSEFSVENPAKNPVKFNFTAVSTGPVFGA